MADFPGRPQLLKGARVVFDTPIPIPTNVIIFQYNPETMTRKISQPAVCNSVQVQAARRLS